MKRSTLEDVFLTASRWFGDVMLTQKNAAAAPVKEAVRTSIRYQNS